MENEQIKNWAIGCLIALVVILTIVSISKPTSSGYTQEQLNDIVDEKVNTATTALDSTITDMQGQIDDLKLNETKDEDEDEDTSLTKEYWKKEFDLNTPIILTIKDNDVDKLIDGTINFKGKNINVREEIIFDSPEFATSSESLSEYGDDIYLEMLNRQVKYLYIFEDDIALEDISKDDPLKIKFSGKEWIIISADTNSIVIQTGEKIFLEEGESKSIDGKKVTLDLVGSNENAIRIKVDNVTAHIDLFDSKVVNELEIYVESIVRDSVELYVGTDTEKEIDNNDPADEESRSDAFFIYKIKTDGTNLVSIGYELNQNLFGTSRDIDALGIGDSLKLLNDYLEIFFKKTNEPSTIDYQIYVDPSVDYDFEIISSDDEGFVYGTKEYDRVYTNETGIYDGDGLLIVDDLTPIDLGESGYTLFSNLTMTGYDLMNLPVNIDSDEDIKTDDGRVFSNSKDWNIDFKNLDLTIPEEKETAFLSIEG